MTREEYIQRIRTINQEQCRRMKKHRRACSERMGQDVGETGFFDWVDKHASEFRQMVETLPFQCVQCGACDHPIHDGLCTHPFGEERLRRIYKKD